VRRVITNPLLILRICFRDMSRGNNFLIEMNMMLKLKVFDDFNFFVDWNYPPKFDEDVDDDVEGEDLNPKFLVCDVCKEKILGF
jgi:hypothetical protein